VSGSNFLIDKDGQRHELADPREQAALFRRITEAVRCECVGGRSPRCEPPCPPVSYPELCSSPYRCAGRTFCISCSMRR
jgi:hypothetical protein